MQDNSNTSLVFTFDSNEFGKIRTYSNPNGGVLFCAKDVCDCLGYANNRKAIADHCKGVTDRYTLVTVGGAQDFVFITEPDVMRLIVSSKLPAATGRETGPLRWRVVALTFLREARKP